MKKQQEVVVVRKSRCGWWSVIKALLILAGLVFITVKLYDKFVAKKKAAELPDDADGSADGDASAVEAADDDADTGLCASAADVIANPENMD